MSSQIEERKSRLEATLSKIAGVPVELTVRGDVSFTISADGNREAELMKAFKFFGTAIQNVSFSFDAECDCSCLYFDVKS